MPARLQVAIGQYSSPGRKPTQQDFHGACLPAEPALSAKGIVLAIADGISSSEFSHIASQTAVRSLLEDYYCTSDAWSVKNSVERVLAATNAWLYAQTQQGLGRHDKDRGHVCTLSALVLKSGTAHLFHVGDGRICRVHAQALEPLTQEHRVRISSQESYLGRALGIAGHLEVDYRALAVAPGDIFLLTTDGVHEHVGENFILAAVAAHADDLHQAARHIGEEAFQRGSPDNLTVQLLRVESVPDAQAGDIRQQVAELPPPPILEPRMVLDGYRIVREIHASSRSHIYLAVNEETREAVALKTPAIDVQGDPACLERFLMEEWIARRLASAHVLKPCGTARLRRHLYVAMEYVEGRTLAQWMIDHPRPSLDAVRGIVAQIARGLRAFHRLEMLHQDLRPENILIDATGTVKIIDFGSTRVAGIAEAMAPGRNEGIPGTAQYAAPEYFLGEEGTPRSDLFALGVLSYQMLGGKLPYGLEPPKTRSRTAQRKLRYASLLEVRRDIPRWIDEAIQMAVQPDPAGRQGDVSEFMHDLHHPRPEFLVRRHVPLIERHPVLFWKTLALGLTVALVAVLALQAAAR
ncbi:bifunctional protein-serine/threonine kinase/phosphatase [Azohydromonas caseinilytica]|uniref:Bifunctional protein-serine/threonine kinase/phosphatase n=1 Tax=Azohydromonas caseinilytica TaxID=2728836 RepID=A0A848F7L9_9BURK|nr:bifunctional protein-serine/threonine kinase/phosphatase [Azohydromonas caseinilytica]NML14343.1 bifunctional protein-serine/threonine kinase/phosphatase [Azohydromonas caseinilytica]